MEARQSVAFGEVPGAEPMQEPEAVVAMLRLSALGDRSGSRVSSAATGEP